MMKRSIFSILLATALTSNAFAQAGLDLVTMDPDDRFTDNISRFNRNYSLDEEGRDNDFGMDVSFELTKKFGRRFDVSLAGNIRFQDHNNQLERKMLSAGIGYKFYDTKKLDLKVGFDFDYYSVQKLSEASTFEKFEEHYDDKTGLLNGYNYRKGYKVTDSYWRGRERYSFSLTGSYKPSKRWTISLRETFQYSHYNRTDSLSRTRVTTERHKWREAYVIDDLPEAPAYDLASDTETMLYYDKNVNGLNGSGYTFPLGDDPVLDSYGNEVYPAKGLATPYGDPDYKAPRTPKDLIVLRSKLTIEYNIKGLPLNPFVSLDYGRGLNYHAWKWKYTIGMDLKVDSNNKFTLFYRFQHENDDDEPNGHLLGIGYKITL